MESALSVIEFLQLESDNYIKESRKYLETKVKEIIAYTFDNNTAIYYDDIYYIKIFTDINLFDFKKELEKSVPDLEFRIEIYQYTYFINYKKIRIAEIINIFYPYLVNNNLVSLAKYKSYDKVNKLNYYKLHPKYLLCYTLRELYSPINYDKQDEYLQQSLSYVNDWKRIGGINKNNKYILFDHKIFTKYINLVKDNFMALFGIADNTLYITTLDITPVSNLLQEHGCIPGKKPNQGKIYDDIRLQTNILSIPDNQNKIRLFNSLAYELIPAYKGTYNLHKLVLLRYILVEYNILDIINEANAANKKLATFINKYEIVLSNVSYENCDFYGIYYPDSQYRKILFLENITKQNLKKIT